MVSDSLISVVIPCYNQSQYLRECLQSLLSQTFKNWEAIVVDDASSQGNVESVVLSFHDTRIRFVRHQCNLGLAAARNTGFRLAQAQMVLPLDADDMLSPAYLEKVGSVLFDHPDADCAFSDFQLFGERTDLWRNQVRNAVAMTQSQWIPGPGTLMRRSLWEHIGGYCEASELRFGNEDWDFWLRAVAIGVRAIHVPEALYLYRWQKTSMAIRLRYYDFQTREFIYHRHRALFDRYGTGNKFRAEGYLNSARVAWRRGERLRATYLVAQGLAAYYWTKVPNKKKTFIT